MITESENETVKEKEGKRKEESVSEVNEVE
jgi:hypothetical protein